MKKFKDKEGGSWEFPLTIGDVFRVKEASEGRFDLFEPSKEVDGTPLAQLLDESDGAFWELLCYLLEPQVRANKATSRVGPKEDERVADFELFGQLLAADCWPVCRRLFFETWCDFFQSLQRPDKALPLEKMAKYQAKALELVKAQIAHPRLTELDPKVYAKMQSALSKSFGASLDSLDAILADTPSASSTK